MKRIHPVDDNDPTTYVVSKLDGKKYRRITHKHTKRFNMSLDEYKEKFNLKATDLFSEKLMNATAVTEKNLIEKYGEIEGLKRWNTYREKQAISNSFEYKKEKHGMTEEEFRKFNLSRAVTLENLVKKHGQIEGEKKFKKYCERQAYAGCSIDYFIEKYGEVEGKAKYEDICKRKALTLENMISKYGKDEGMKRYNSWASERKSYFHSPVSEELFDKLSPHFPDHVIWYPKVNEGKEYFCYDEINNKIFFYDYVDLTSRKCIEFNGDIFHGNPKIYKEDDRPNPWIPELTSGEMWKQDSDKIKLLKEVKGIDTFVVWEKDYRDDPEKVITDCLNFLKNYES